VAVVVVMKARFQFRLRTLMIAVTVLALPLGYIGWQAKIVGYRKVVLDNLVKHAYAIEPVLNPTYRVTGLRHWLGDVAIEQFGFDDDATDDEICEVRRAFPKAAIWRGVHPPRLIE
jgi:hypothetical protein